MGILGAAHRESLGFLEHGMSSNETRSATPSGSDRSGMNGFSHLKSERVREGVLMSVVETVPSRDSGQVSQLLDHEMIRKLHRQEGRRWTQDTGNSAATQE